MNFILLINGFCNEVITVSGIFLGAYASCELVFLLFTEAVTSRGAMVIDVLLLYCETF